MTQGVSYGTLKLVPLPQKVIAAASIGSSYTLITSVFGNSIGMLAIISTLDQPVQLSWNGVDDNIPCVSNATIILDFRANNASLSGAYGVYVKEIGNPTTGSLYVCGFTV